MIIRVLLWVLILSGFALANVCVDFYDTHLPYRALGTTTQHNSRLFDLGTITPETTKLDPFLYSRPLKYTYNKELAPDQSVKNVYVRPISDLGAIQKTVVNDLREAGTRSELIERSYEYSQIKDSIERAEQLLIQAESLDITDTSIQIRLKRSLEELEKVRLQLLVDGIEVGKWVIALDSGKFIVSPIVTSYSSSRISGRLIYLDGYLKTLSDLKINRSEVIEATVFHTHPGKKFWDVFLSAEDVRLANTMLFDEAKAGNFPVLNIVAITSDKEFPYFSQYGHQMSFINRFTQTLREKFNLKSWLKKFTQE